MKKIIALLLTIACAVSLLACGGLGGEEATTAPQIETFAEYTDLEIFQDVPAFADMRRVTIRDADDYGDGYYVLALTGAFPAEFKEYLKILESAGFTKLADNGATGIDKTVLSGYYRRGDLTLHVAFSSLEITTYISATKAACEVSPHLTNSPAFTEGIIEGAQTTLYMQQVPEYGNCYVIQLKNGHFIVNDGGWEGDLRTLLDWLQEMAPEGQKPVVEAWFVSHEHEDHNSILRDAVNMYDVADRVAVEGVYVSMVREELKQITGATNIGKTTVYRSYLKNSAGEMTPIYRPHLGDRYYFCDITVEVPYTQEQLAFRNYVDNLNPSSTWLMYNIEGQKFLLAGDAEEVNMKQVAEMYDPSYMDVDIMNAHHHGLNTYTENLGYFQTQTLLYSTWGVYSIYWPADCRENNLIMQKKHCEEYVSYIEGGVKLTFPYTVGSYEILEPWYPDTSSSLIERQAQWLKDAGLTYPLQ